MKWIEGSVSVSLAEPFLWIALVFSEDESMIKCFSTLWIRFYCVRLEDQQRHTFWFYLVLVRHLACDPAAVEKKNLLSLLLFLRHPAHICISRQYARLMCGLNPRLGIRYTGRGICQRDTSSGSFCAADLVQLWGSTQEQIERRGRDGPTVGIHPLNITQS